MLHRCSRDPSGVPGKDRITEKQQMNKTTILNENLQYWTYRAESYSQVNQRELQTPQHCIWQNTLCQELQAHFPGRPHETIRILDVGCGPGFFSIVLAEEGFDVTAIDLTSAMLQEARENAGNLAFRICFMEMNAEELSFPDHSFDAIVSRNLTWNLPHPEQAYKEWFRVLKPGGVLLNFDANWYHYLNDEQARKAYQVDRDRSAALGIRDENIGDGFDAMEDIASRIPMTKAMRPKWDRIILESMGVHVTINEQVWNHVWSEEEQINFSSTPMFLICGKKPL